MGEGKRGRITDASLSRAENFLEQPIKSQGKVYSAAGAGKIPFVSTEDIAAVAHAALVSEQAPNREYTILGPELLSYDEVSIRGSVLALGGDLTFVRLGRSDPQRDSGA